MNNLIKVQYLNPLIPRWKTKIFFLHMHKCGGTSIELAIRKKINLFDRDKSFHLDVDAHSKMQKGFQRPLLQSRRELLYYAMAGKQYQYISGHFPYSEKAMNNFGDQWNFVTIFREPISRWFSHYFYNRHKTHSDICKVESDLEAYIESKSAIFSGTNYVQYLNEDLDENYLYSNDAVDSAFDNLNRFALFGTLENIDFFQHGFRRAFKFNLDLSVKNKNPLPASERNMAISSKMRDRVEELCQPNIKLYKRVVKVLKT